jgi:hypothetical protein
MEKIPGQLPPTGAGIGSGKSQTGQTPQEEQVEALAHIHVVSFTAKPTSVKPFQPATLAWNVQVPATVPPDATLVVGGKSFPLKAGSTTVNPFATTTFDLIAKGPQRLGAVSYVLAQQSVAVDTSACASSQIPEAALVPLIAQQVTAGLPSSNDFTLEGKGVVVALTAGTITITIPLHINVPDYFDATMTIVVPISVGMQGAPPEASIAVNAAETKVDVAWSWLANLLSGEITKVLAIAMERVAQAFMSEIATAQIATGIQHALGDQLTSVATQAQTSDPQGRTFALTSFNLTSGGIAFSVCPR